jgi:hypothetical protein
VQLDVPGLAGRLRQGDVGQDPVADRREQVVLVAEMPVQRHRRHVVLLCQPADGERLQPFRVGDLQRAGREFAGFEPLGGLAAGRGHVDKFTT